MFKTKSTATAYFCSPYINVGDGVWRWIFKLGDANSVKQAFIVLHRLVVFLAPTSVFKLFALSRRITLCDVNVNTKFIVRPSLLYSILLAYIDSREFERSRLRSKQEEYFLYICFSKHFQEAKELHTTPHLLYRQYDRQRWSSTSIIFERSFV